MSKATNGSCMCGQVTYQVNGVLRPITACHCIQCRKSSGHYSAATSTANENLKIQGDSLKWFKSSEVASRGFCGTCGSNLFWRPVGKGRTSIFTGSIDGPTELKTENQIFVESKGDYYELPDVPVIEQADLG